MECFLLDAYKTSMYPVILIFRQTLRKYML